MFGVINCLKPRGPTSRDCVNRLQFRVKPHKVGHAGTLDPLAEGVLLIAIGSAVRLVDWIHRLPKAYRAVFHWGQTSPSAHAGTAIRELETARVPSQAEVEAGLAEFRGKIQQVPPIFSAIQIDGKRAHRLARAGKEVALPPREVTIHRLELVEFAYPRMVLDIQCSTGTYVRSLGRDIARRCGSDAVMTELVRTAIGPMDVSAAVPLAQLDSREAIIAQLQNPSRLLTHLPRVTLSKLEIRTILDGKTIELAEQQHGELLGVDEAGNIRSILQPASGIRWKPLKNFPEPS
jgi:tRNA pseudouridine55 synthase